MELTNEYSRLIKNARELRGLSQEELGKKINEKTSVISHLETGSMKPDDALARKLEHFLKIQLFVPSEEIDGGQGETG
jgi:putative transcription factor